MHLGRADLIRTEDADLVEVVKKVAWIAVNPVGACPAKLVIAVAAGQEANPPGASDALYQDD